MRAKESTNPGATVSVRRGRPRKFAKPSRAITLTLPLDVIAAVRNFDPDLARGIVRLARSLSISDEGPRRLSFEGARNKLIVVPPTQALVRHAGVRLVPLLDGRAFIAFGNELSVDDLELRLSDALQDGELTTSDRLLFEELVGLLGEARRGGGRVRIERQAILLIEGRAAKRTAPDQVRNRPDD
jgi:hypothetical protein